MDWNFMIMVIEWVKMIYEFGVINGYYVFIYGWFIGELI